MQFRARSKSRVLEDLTSKLQSLPPRHPGRPALIRMIVGLSADMARRRSCAARPADDRGDKKGHRSP
jgi:hypothetical protein